MSIFARLFGQSEATAEMAAADLGLHLLRMAMAVEDTLGLRHSEPNKSGIAMQEILLAYLNLVDRSLFGLFGPGIRDKAMQHMDALLPQSITAALCSDWPKELREKHSREFADNMRLAEQEYGHLKIMGRPHREDLFMRCAQNVVRHLGLSGDMDKAVQLYITLMKTYTQFPMTECVRGLGNAVRS